MKDALSALWWYRLPAMAARRKGALALLLADGFYLERWPQLAAWAPLLAFAAGVAAGGTHFSRCATFTCSLVLMTGFVVIATLAGALGLWLWVGYVLGDLFLFYPQMPPGLGRFLTGRLAPAILSYLLLFMLVSLPMASQALRRRVLPRLATWLSRRLIAGAVLQGVIQTGLAFVWIHAVPTLIRPVFTWRENLPSIEAVAPLQKFGGVLIVLAALAAFGRVLLQVWSFTDIELAGRALDLQELLVAGERRAGPAVPPWLRVSMQALLSTFLLAGLLATWLDALLLWGCLAAVLALQRMIPRWRRWTAVAARVPWLARLAAAVVASYWISATVVKSLWPVTSTFRPVTVAIVLSITVFAFLFPLSATESTAVGGAKR
jgi:hypothetical protein